MRTTVTLDPDVVAALRQAMRDRGLSFKQALNETVRRGLQAQRAPKEYSMPSRRMGIRPGIDLDKAHILATDSEDGEILRKIELRK